MVSSPTATDLDARVERLDAFLDEHDYAAIWLARPNSFRWLTGGSNVVDRSATLGVAAVCYDGDLRVLTDNIEGDRLASEELPEEFTVETVPWHTQTLTETVLERSALPAAADFDVPGFSRVDASTFRQPLTRRDVERYRSVAEESAAIVENVCRNVDHEASERDVAVALEQRFAEHEIEAPVVLVGGSHRTTRFRHYTPTDTPLGRYALVSVTTQREGHHASCTRTVAFDAPVWLEERHEKAAQVEVSALAATQSTGIADGTAGDVFRAIEDAYASVDHPAEWRNHHQGGAAGFAGREWIATPESDQPVVLPMAFAWNPTIEGAKSEDTTLVTESEFETLTSTGEWPTIEVSAVDDDLTLDRPAILHR